MKERKTIKVKGEIVDTGVSFDVVIKHLKNQIKENPLYIHYCARREGWWSNGSYISIELGSAYKELLYDEKGTLFGISTNLFVPNDDKIHTRMPYIDYCIPDRYTKCGYTFNVQELLASDWQTFIIDPNEVKTSLNNEIYLKM